MTDKESFNDLVGIKHIVLFDKDVIPLGVYYQKQNLVAMLKHFNYSQYDMARASGCNYSTVNSIVNNKTPKLQTVLAFASSLGLPVTIKVIQSNHEINELDFFIGEEYSYHPAAYSLKSDLKKKLSTLAIEIFAKSNLTKEELSVRSGVNKTSLEEVLCNRRSFNHSAELIVKVIIELGCTVFLCFDYKEAKKIKRKAATGTTYHGRVFKHSSVFLRER